MRRYWTLWGVVHVMPGGPIWIDGPYKSRAVAREVKRMNEEERDADPNVDRSVRLRVVPMTYLVPESELGL